MTNGASKVPDPGFWLDFITELHYASIRENPGSPTSEAPFVKLRSSFFDRTKNLERSYMFLKLFENAENIRDSI